MSILALGGVWLRNQTLHLSAIIRQLWLLIVLIAFQPPHPTSPLRMRPPVKPYEVSNQ